MSNDLTCEHCMRRITDMKSMWSRSGHHWCSVSCYKQDNQADNQVEERKRLAKAAQT